MDTFLHVRSDRFLPLPDEESEIVNEGMYGKALADFLQKTLTAMGYEAPFSCCEDWGWWVELKGFPVAFGVCIYACSITPSLMEYAITDGAVTKKVWSWRKFRYIDMQPHADRLLNDLQEIISETEGLELISVSTDFPLEPPNLTENSPL